MNVRRKLTLTLMILLFAVASLGTATFAWFTIAQNAKVETISMDVISDEGQIWISLDGEDWNEKVDWSAIKAKIVEDSKNNPKAVVKFDDVADLESQMGLNNVTTKDLNEFYNKINSTADLAVENVDYVVFNLYFRTKDEGAYLYLSNEVDSKYTDQTAAEGTFANSKGRTFTSPVDFEYSETKSVNKGDEVSYFAVDSLRIGIKELQYDLDASLKAKDERTSNDMTKFIWDVASDDENDRAYGYGNVVESEKTIGKYGAIGYYNKVKSTDYAAPTGEDLKAVQDITIYELTKFKSRYAQTDETGKSSQCATFLEGSDGEYYYAKVQVTMWLEGWDGDCFDGILGDSLKVQLYFRTGKVQSK